MRQVGDVGAIADGSSRHAKRRSQLEYLLDRVLHEPGTQLLEDFGPLALTGPLIVPLDTLDEVGATHHGQHVVPLLHGDGGEAYVAVFAPLDAGDHRHRQLARAAGEGRQQGRIGQEGHGQTFED